MTQLSARSCSSAQRAAGTRAMKPESSASSIDGTVKRAPRRGKLSDSVQQVALGGAVAQHDGRLQGAVKAVEPRLGGDLGQPLGGECRQPAAARAPGRVSGLRPSHWLAATASPSSGRGA